MNIEITDTSAGENFLKHYEIQWELSSKKGRKQNIRTTLIYAGLIVLGIFDVFKNDENTGALIDVPIGTIFISVGITLVFISLNNLRTYARYNKSNLEYIKKTMRLFEKGENQLSITLTDDFISLAQYKNSETIYWEYFNYYSIHEDLIILHQNPKVIQNFVVRRELITEQEYEEFLFFVSQRMERHLY